MHLEKETQELWQYSLSCIYGLWVSMLPMIFLQKTHGISAYTHVRWKKQDIEEQIQNIETPKQDIEIPEAFSNKTKQHIQILFAEFGNDKFFGRTEVMKALKITASPSSELIKKMLESELIHPMRRILQNQRRG